MTLFEPFQEIKRRFGISPVGGIPLTADGALTDSISANVQEAFEKLGERDTIAAQHLVLNGLAAETERVRESEPDLTDMECRLVAKRIIKQRLMIYLGAIDQIY